MYFVDFEYVQGGVMLEEESTPGRGPSMVFVLVVGATQGWGSCCSGTSTPETSV